MPLYAMATARFELVGLAEAAAVLVFTTVAVEPAD